MVLNLTGPGELDVGSRLVLECRIRVILPTVVTWEKDGEELSNTSRISISPIIDGLSTLTIGPVVPGDGGTYRCGTTSDAGTDPGRKVQVNVISGGM